MVEERERRRIAPIIAQRRWTAAEQRLLGRFNDAELARRNLKAAGYRLLGYNSPFVPRSKQTHELQAILR